MYAVVMADWPKRTCRCPDRDWYNTTHPHATAAVSTSPAAWPCAPARGDETTWCHRSRSAPPADHAGRAAGGSAGPAALSSLSYTSRPRSADASVASSADADTPDRAGVAGLAARNAVSASIGAAQPPAAVSTDPDRLGKSEVLASVSNLLTLLRVRDRSCAGPAWELGCMEAGVGVVSVAAAAWGTDAVSVAVSQARTPSKGKSNTVVGVTCDARKEQITLSSSPHQTPCKAKSSMQSIYIQPQPLRRTDEVKCIPEL